jgi:hypothetical protein
MTHECKPSRAMRTRKHRRHLNRVTKTRSHLSLCRETRPRCVHGVRMPLDPYHLLIRIPSPGYTHHPVATSDRATPSLYREIRPCRPHGGRISLDPYPLPIRIQSLGYAHRPVVTSNQTILNQVKFQRMATISRAPTWPPGS